MFLARLDNVRSTLKSGQFTLFLQKEKEANFLQVVHHEN
jgi:hypothetical protein